MSAKIQLDWKTPLSHIHLKKYLQQQHVMLMLAFSVILSQDKKSLTKCPYGSLSINQNFQDQQQTYSSAEECYSQLQQTISSHPVLQCILTVGCCRIQLDIWMASCFDCLEKCNNTVCEVLYYLFISNSRDVFLFLKNNLNKTNIIYIIINLTYVGYSKL